MEITLESVLVRSEDLLESDLGTEKVMMSIDKGLYYGLNEVAKTIHDSCDGETALSEIVLKLTSEYEVEPKECEETVIHFCQGLVGNGLLKMAST